MKPAIFVLVLAAIVLADNQIDLNCHQCGANACIVLTGGPFNGKDMKTTSASCASAGSFPASVTFQCDQGDCSDGCFMTETSQGTSFGFCSNTPTGKGEVDALNMLYSIQQNDFTLKSTYDWCGCGLSTMAIIGIIIGVLIGVGIIGGLVYYFIVKKKKQTSNYSSIVDSQG